MPRPKKEKVEYAISWNGEEYFEGGFSSVAEALKAADFYALAQHPQERSTTVHVGKVCRFQPKLSLHWVLEHLSEQAYDECGEWSEDWLYDVSDELDGKLQKMLDRFVKTLPVPRFYTVQDSEELPLPGTAKED